MCKSCLVILYSCNYVYSGSYYSIGSYYSSGCVSSYSSGYSGGCGYGGTIVYSIQLCERRLSGGKCLFFLYFLLLYLSMSNKNLNILTYDDVAKK